MMRPLVSFPVVLIIVVGCHYPNRHEDRADTTVTIVQPAVGQAMEESPQPEQTDPPDSIQAQPYYLYDSLEHNIATGTLLGDPKIQTQVKFVFYAYDRYEEYGLKPGDTLNGYFASGQSGPLTRYEARPVVTQYDSTNEWLTFPLFPEGQWPAFLLKGLPTTDVKGKLLDWSFFKPSDSLTIELGDNSFLLHVEGTTVGYVVKNYALHLESTIGNRKHKTLLWKHKYLPFVNATDIVPDFVYWAGDLNNDNILDLITGDGVKSCSTLRLWLGNRDFKFDLKARFDGCGC